MTKKTTNDDTFVNLKFTNRDVYNSVEDLKQTVLKMKQDNDKGHADILTHQAFTNGKVRVHTKLFWTFGTAVVMTVLLFALNNVLGVLG